MNEEWWESPVCFICDYWWALLLVIVLALAAFFTRDLWLPLLGYEPRPTPVELGTGDIQATLTWDSGNDIDLWVIDPAGEAIYYKQPTSTSGGRLDVDANADCTNLTSSPVENIFWPPGEAPAGEYQVEVHYYKQCESPAPTAYQLRLLVDGQVTSYSGTIDAQDDIRRVASFIRQGANP